jgi:peptide deformylase
VRELIKLPNPLLRQKSEPVKEVNRRVKELALEMVDFMRLHRGDAANPVGLSAVQLGELVRIELSQYSRQAVLPKESQDSQDKRDHPGWCSEELPRQRYPSPGFPARA